MNSLPKSKVLPTSHEGFERASLVDVGFRVAGLTALIGLGGSGALKLLDLSEFSQALQTWSLLPGGLRPLVTGLVPIAEVGVCIAAFGAGNLRLALGAGIGLLLLFFAAYGTQAYLAQAPTCGCVGKIREFHDFRLSAPQHLATIGAFLLLLVLGFWSTRCPNATQAQSNGISPSRTAGFTLIETLLVMVIASVLAALIIPQLSRVRSFADQAVSLSNIRTHVTILSQYASDYRDTTPCFIDPAATYGVIRVGDFVTTANYFDMTVYWNLPMSELYYQSSPRSPVFARPRHRVEYATDYSYSSSFLAHPDFWVAELRTGPDQWGPVKLTDVSYPDRKGAFFSRVDWAESTFEYTHQVSGIPLGMTDGSARAIQPSKLLPPYWYGEGNWQGSRYSYGIPVLHTPGGVRGRDIQ